jgi:predicted DsbA family dithiol-disulfide isomerase
MRQRVAMTQPAPTHLIVRIEVHVDILCEWCYLTKRSLESAIQQQKIKQPDAVFDVRWRPFYRFPLLKTGT